MNMHGPQSFSDIYNTYELAPLDQEHEDVVFRRPALLTIDRVADHFGHTILFLTPQPHDATLKTPGGITVRETRTQLEGGRIKVGLSVWAL